jgi:hypothetical protein
MINVFNEIYTVTSFSGQFKSIYFILHECIKVYSGYMEYVMDMMCAWHLYQRQPDELTLKYSIRAGIISRKEVWVSNGQHLILFTVSVQKDIGLEEL